MNGKKKWEVYRDLYKIVNDNMKTSGNSIEFKEGTFLTTVGERSYVADLLRWQECDSETFLENGYYQLLERMPDGLALARWKAESKMRQQDKQKKMLVSIINSQEFMLKNTYIKNNVYERHDFEYSGFKAKLRNGLIKRVRMLPVPIKRMIKTICRIK